MKRAHRCLLLFVDGVRFGRGLWEQDGAVLENSSRFSPKSVGVVGGGGVVGGMWVGFGAASSYHASKHPASFRRPARRKRRPARAFIMACWPRPDLLYATIPLSRLRIDAQFRLLEDSVFGWNQGPRLYIEADPGGERLLYVQSVYVDASAGALYELEVATGRRRMLRDSTWAVSSARYWPGSERRVVFYSYGRLLPWNPSGPEAGYYVLDLETLEDSLLFAYASPAGPKEIFNGFDISPDGRILLIPRNHYPIGYPRAPQLIAFDLQTGRVDTLSWDFDYDFLWLRFSPDGRRLLYGTYPFGVLDYTSAGGTEIGVIDMETGERRVLETTTFFACASMDLFPRWSPDGRHIVYSSAPVLCPEGAVSPYFSLYIFKDVN